MANTYTLISSVTVGSGGASTIDFTSIPQTYTDLLMVLSARVGRATSASTICLTFNGSSSGYSQKNLDGNGASVTSSSGSGAANITYMEVPAANATASTFGNHSIYIPNYTGSSYKSVSIDTVSENNGTTAYANLNAGLWSNTAAITSISWNEPNGSSSFAQYSTAYLYGIKNS
jgi:hypothetical protein